MSEGRKVLRIDFRSGAEKRVSIWISIKLRVPRRRELPAKGNEVIRFTLQRVLIKSMDKITDAQSNQFPLK